MTAALKTLVVNCIQGNYSNYWYGHNGYLFHCRVNWVKECGILYQKEACVVIRFKESEDPIFGRIVNVYIVKSIVLLEIKVHETVEFNEHVHAFVVREKTDSWVYIWTSNLCDYWMYGLYTKPGLRTDYDVVDTKLIILKYKICVQWF